MSAQRNNNGLWGEGDCFTLRTRMFHLDDRDWATAFFGVFRALSFSLSLSLLIEKRNAEHNQHSKSIKSLYEIRGY